MDRNNHKLNTIIESFIEMYSGTAIGQEIKNMYENGAGYEWICDKIEIDYGQYTEE